MSSFKARKALFEKMRKTFSLRLVNKIIFLAAFLMFGAYIFGANALSVKGFELSEMNKQINDLNDSNTELELNIMKLESYALVNERIKSLGLVKVEKIDYITPSIGVARK